MATKVNIVIDQGTDFSTSINLTDADGLLLDLTSMTAASQIRKSYTSINAASFSVTLANNTSQLILSMNNAVTSSLTAGRYVYDVELSDASNIKTRILEGIVTVTPEVTR